MENCTAEQGIIFRLLCSKVEIKFVACVHTIPKEKEKFGVHLDMLLRQGITNCCCNRILFPSRSFVQHARAMQLLKCDCFLLSF